MPQLSPFTKVSVAAASLMLLLAGCSSSPDPSETTAPVQSEASSSQNAGLESAQTAAPEANANEYGAERELLQVGEQGGWTYPGTDDLGFGLTVTNIVLDPVCEGEEFFPAQAPENGRFVELTIEAVTATDYERATGTQLAFTWDAFASETADGRVVQSTAAAMTCLPLDAGFEGGALAPGFTQTARFVVDVPVDATGVSWNPLGDGGFSWALPV